MKVAVLIPTLGRKKELIDTVNGILAQSVPPDEIVIVDQNSPTDFEVEKFLSEIPIVLHLKEQPPGVVANYNRCWKASQCEIVIFVDDDVLPDKKLIEAHLKNYNDVSVGAVAGQIHNRLGDGAAKKIRSVGAYSRLTGHVTANFNSKKRAIVQFGQGANMSFRRTALATIGGFDPEFGGNGYFFETDAGLRLSEAGYKMVFDPAATVHHLQAPSGGARVHDKSLHTYYFIRNGMTLYRRHSPKWGLPFFITKNGAYALAKAAKNRDFTIAKKGFQALFNANF